MAEQLILSAAAPHLANQLWGGSLVQQTQTGSGWFVGDPMSSGLDPARQAFEDAVKEFRKEVSEEECSKWLNSATTICDVEEAVISAKERYEKKSGKSRARKWLASCSSRLMYYSVIMDTLSQHHPEYVSLAWGAIKFLFIAVLNHEELLTEISKTISQIADVLPRADLSANLYPTPRMKAAVAQLYAKILHFVRDAVKWYKKSKLAHSVSAVFKPYDLGFKVIVEEISRASRRVDQEASAASKAEIRELHIKLQQFAQLSMAHYNSHSLAIMNLTDQLTHQTRVLGHQQITQIKSMPSLAHLPDPEECLKYCQSIKMRRRTHLLLHPSQISKLREWHETPAAFPILIAHGRGLRTIVRDFAVDLLEVLRASGVPAIWTLSHTHSDLKIGVSTTDILLSLSMQALLLNPQALNRGPSAISSHHFQNALTEEQAFKLFDRCISGVSKLYIILDMAVVNAAVGYHDTLINAFVQKFLNLLLAKPGGGIKLVVAAEEFNNNFEVEEQDLLDSSRIFVGGQSPGIIRRTGGRRGYTRYSSHVFALRSGMNGITNWLSEEADTSKNE